MNDWIGYYAAFYGVLCFFGFMKTCGDKEYVVAILAMAAPTPLILHAWGVL